jgi:murein tripeptide amidase MpaA
VNAKALDASVDQRVTFDGNRYRTHEELTAVLHALVAAYPGLAAMASIGTSHQGRDIWVVTITNRATGADSDKPALYIDANNHGEEVVTAATALIVIHEILSHFGHDAAVTELLDTRALYIAPCINPDGAEICLTTPYRTVGNGHFLPWEEQPTGLHLEDIDGDGRIGQMRIPDPKGEWKISERNRRLMTLRGPGEIGGDYFRLIPEGMVRDWNGTTIPIEKPRHGNLNRQYPVNWLPESGEYGAGDLPLNEPEAESIAHFVLAHPNITGVQALHSHGGLILRPSGFRPDTKLSASDVDLHRAIGAVGERLTGYPVISTFEGFTEHASMPRHGTFTDWTYEHLGLVSFCPELWDVAEEAGITKGQYFHHHAQNDDDEATLLAWSDTHSPEAYADWRPFDHPQFGQIELGGWDPFWFQRNPPPHLLRKVAEPIARFIIHHAAASPLVRIASLTAKPFGSSFFRIAAEVENRGYLPTNVTDQALQLGIARAASVTLETAPHIDLLMGDKTQQLGHLAGRVTRTTLYDAWRDPWGEPAARAEWLVRIKAEERVELCVRSWSEKGGVDEARLVVGG